MSDMQAVVMGLVLMVLSSTIFYELGKSHAPERQEAIERGYALHCPKDGRFAWKGECDE
jgi:hypothetical protein